MKEISKLLIAYDGSACSDAALKDLPRAGLPTAVEAVVATIAQVFVPPPEDEVPDDEIISPGAAAMVRPYQLRAPKAVQSALATAEQAAVRVKADFSGWSARTEAEGGTPEWELINMADDLKVDSDCDRLAWPLICGRKTHPRQRVTEGALRSAVLRARGAVC